MSNSASTQTGTLQSSASLLRGKGHHHDVRQLSGLLLLGALFRGCPASYALAQQTGAAAAATAAPKPAPLTNRDVLKMLRAGIPQKVIVVDLHEGGLSRIDASTDALVALRHAGATDRLLAAVLGDWQHALPQELPPLPPVSVDTSASASTGTGAPPEDSQTATQDDYPDQPGFYYKGPDGYQAMISQTGTQKAHGFFAATMTEGLAPVKSVIELRGRHAELRLNATLPAFYLVRIVNVDPEEISFLRLREKKHSREFEIGRTKMAGFKAKVAYDPKQLVRAKVTTEAPYIFRIVPAQPLTPGEYAIVLSTDTPTVGAYPFGVRGGGSH